VKRVLATILAIIYFTASTSASVNIHYCMGKLQSMDLWYAKGKKEVCANCGMISKKGCCEDKHQVVKLEKKYNIPVTGVSATKVISLPAPYYQIYLALIQPGDIAGYSSLNSPPGKEYSPLYIRNCVFRI